MNIPSYKNNVASAKGNSSSKKKASQRQRSSFSHATSSARKRTIFQKIKRYFFTKIDNITQKKEAQPRKQTARNKNGRVASKVKQRGGTISIGTLIFRFILSFLGAGVLTFCVLFGVEVSTRSNLLKNPVDFQPTQDEINSLEGFLNENYATERSLLHPLPYKTLPVNLDVNAKSAICVNADNGSILYEKNADEVIPPASLTKMFVMYVAMEYLERGEIALDDVVPLHNECLAINMMPHSSLMFLGEHQVVTMEQLMTGLCVDSGNDAAYAIAFYIIGKEDEKMGMEDQFDATDYMARFVDKMNGVAMELGLVNTHFVESSGYDENNLTTAREMATFCTSYVTRFPKVLEFHSLRDFTWSGIFQVNTNPLLGHMDGCDGLKTGFIHESGYNLALTVKRGDTRVVCVTLGGQGVGGRQGREGRIHDNTQMVDYAFENFYTYSKINLGGSYSVPLVFSKNTRMTLVPAFFPTSLCVPKSILLDNKSIDEQVSINIDVPKMISAPVLQGTAYGSIDYSVSGHLLLSVPLVSSNSAALSSAWSRMADHFASGAL